MENYPETEFMQFLKIRRAVVTQNEKEQFVLVTLVHVVSGEEITMKWDIDSFAHASAIIRHYRRLYPLED